MSGSDPNNERHPDSTFQTEYPYNQATVTRSGHEFHVNDAPGKETLKVAHTTGTYVEIEKTGRWVQVVVEKVYNYFKNTFTQTVDSHADIKVGGTFNFNVDKSSYEAVGLNKTMGVGDKLIDVVGGLRELLTKGDREETVIGTSTTAIRKDYNLDVGGAQTTNIKDTRTEMIGNDWSVTGINTEMIMSGDFRIACRNFIVNATDSVVITTAAGPITITAAGVVYVNGTQIRLNG